MLDRVSNDIDAALKNGDKTTADALKMLKNSLVNAKIALRHDLTEEDAVKVIQKEIKLRVEARDMYTQHGKEEQAKKEEYERQLFSKYAPKELDEQELRDIVKRQHEILGGGANFGSLMAATMKEVSGRADGRTVSEVVKSYFGG